MCVYCFSVTVDTATGPNSQVYVKREPQEHKALLHGILSQHHAALLASYTASNTGKYNKQTLSTLFSYIIIIFGLETSFKWMYQKNQFQGKLPVWGFKWQQKTVTHYGDFFPSLVVWIACTPQGEITEIESPPQKAQGAQCQAEVTTMKSTRVNRRGEEAVADGRKKYSPLPCNN